ncbi:MAG: VanZ family protein [Deltaproteobacteria bacterium]
MRRVFFYWTPVLFYMFSVFLASVDPRPPKLPLIWGMDKIAHFAAYAVMGLLWARALRSGANRAGGFKAFRRVVLAVVVVALFGAFMEVCQMYVPGRSAEELDALANGLGGFLGVLIHERVGYRGRR